MFGQKLTKEQIALLQNIELKEEYSHLKTADAEYYTRRTGAQNPFVRTQGTAIHVSIPFKEVVETPALAISKIPEAAKFTTATKEQIELIESIRDRRLLYAVRSNAAGGDVKAKEVAAKAAAEKAAKEAAEKKAAEAVKANRSNNSNK